MLTTWTIYLTGSNRRAKEDCVSTPQALEKRDPGKWENWKSLIDKRRMATQAREIQQTTTMVSEDAMISVYKNEDWTCQYWDLEISG